MIPVNLNAFTRESGTTIIPKVQSIILSHNCFLIDFTKFSPTEISFTMEGSVDSSLGVVNALSGLGVTFIENPYYEFSSAIKMKGDITVVIFLITGKKKDLGGIMDERMGRL